MLSPIARLVAILAFCSIALGQPAPFQVIPTPQLAVAARGSFAVSSQMRLILGDGVTENDLSLVGRFADLVERHTGRRPAVVEEGRLSKITQGSLYVAPPAGDFARPALDRAGARRLAHGSPDEYLLEVREDGIILVARSERGRFYGMMTLCALLHTEGRRLVVPCGTIRDWPDRPVRGFALLAAGAPTWEIDRLRQLLPLCGALKLSTVGVILPEDGDARAQWQTGLQRLGPLAAENWVEIRLDSSGAYQARERQPEIRLGFLPPGPHLTASIALGARHDAQAADSFLPTLTFTEPATLSADWLEYCAAFIALSSWSSARTDFGLFNRLFFNARSLREADVEGQARLFASLQNLPGDAWWDELWVRPALQEVSLHRTMRRHAIEALTADLAVPPGQHGLSVRVRFLQYTAAHLRGEEVLADSGKRGTSPILAAVQDVTDCLHRLEADLLEESAQRPEIFGLFNLLAATGFQRRLWSDIRKRLERGEPYADLLASPFWMTGRSDQCSDGGLRFRRPFHCAEAPLQARLVIRSPLPVSIAANGSQVPGGWSRSGCLPADQRPARAIELSALLKAGENLVELTVPCLDGNPPAVSAALELLFRDGSAAAIGVDSLWSCRTVQEGRAPGDPDSLWENVLLTQHLPRGPGFQGKECLGPGATFEEPIRK